MYKIFKHRKLPCIPCSGKRILSCNDTTFFLHFFSFYNAIFFHSGYVIDQTSATKLRYWRSSAFYREPWLATPAIARHIGLLLNHLCPGWRFCAAQFSSKKISYNQGRRQRGASGARPSIWNLCPPFHVWPLVAAYIQYSTLKMWSPLQVFGPSYWFGPPAAKSWQRACLQYILTTCPCFDNFEFDIFDGSGPQSHFIMSVTIAVGFDHFPQCIRLS